MNEIEEINNRLRDYSGIAWDNRPIWRLVWSTDQLEKRWTDYNDAGVFLLHREVRELPKYKQWCPDTFVLERLCETSEGSDLVEKTTYEPMWVFYDKNKMPLRPTWGACKLVVDTVMAALGKESLGPKYVDPEKENSSEAKAERISKLEEELFGNETEVGDALAHKQAIVVPGNDKIN